MKGHRCTEMLIPLAFGGSQVSLTTRGLFVYSPGPHAIISSYGNTALDMVWKTFSIKGQTVNLRSCEPFAVAAMQLGLCN